MRQVKDAPPPPPPPPPSAPASTRAVMSTTHGVHRTVTFRWWHVHMTASPVLRPLPDEASVVEVYGSKFLLEWLDLEVLASAAALNAREPVAPSRPAD
jgi:hypothetical protein